MASSATNQDQGKQHSQQRSWPKIPTVGPTWRFEVEYLVKSEAERLRKQMRDAGIEHEALLHLDQRLDAQRVAGYVQTENLFYNCVALHAEKTAMQHAAELNASQQKVIDGFVRHIRRTYPLPKGMLSQRADRPADWQEVVRKCVQSD